MEHKIIIEGREYEISQECYGWHMGIYRGTKKNAEELLRSELKRRKLKAQKRRNVK